MKIIFSIVVLFSTLFFLNGNIGGVHSSEHARGCKIIGHQTVGSPSGQYRAIIFSRDCGTGTSLNTHISILAANEPLADENGNTFIALHESVPVTLRWTDETALQVSGADVKSPEKRNSHTFAIDITYTKA